MNKLIQKIKNIYCALFGHNDQSNPIYSVNKDIVIHECLRCRSYTIRTSFNGLFMLTYRNKLSEEMTKKNTFLNKIPKDSQWISPTIKIPFSVHSVATKTKPKKREN